FALSWACPYFFVFDVQTRKHSLSPSAFLSPLATASSAACILAPNPASNCFPARAHSMQALAAKTRSAMKLISVNVGLPREVPWHDTMVTTSIFKQPVSGRVALRKLNLDGDRQADLRVHGGEYKAVYCYPVEHYAYWKKELPGRDLPFGVFGENFTTEGL